jgi:hypothetical protein
VSFYIDKWATTSLLVAILNFSQISSILNNILTRYEINMNFVVATMIIKIVIWSSIMKPWQPSLIFDFYQFPSQLNSHLYQHLCQISQIVSDYVMPYYSKIKFRLHMLFFAFSNPALPYTFWFSSWLWWSIHMVKCHILSLDSGHQIID